MLVFPLLLVRRATSMSARVPRLSRAGQAEGVGRLPGRHEHGGLTRIKQRDRDATKELILSTLPKNGCAACGSLSCLSITVSCDGRGIASLTSLTANQPSWRREISGYEQTRPIVEGDFRETVDIFMHEFHSILKLFIEYEMQSGEAASGELCQVVSCRHLP